MREKDNFWENKINENNSKKYLSMETHKSKILQNSGNELS